MSAERDAARLAGVKADMARARQHAAYKRRIRMLAACAAIAVGLGIAFAVLHGINFLCGG